MYVVFAILDFFIDEMLLFFQANGFYHGMFENPGPLPLLIPSDMSMLPPHQMLSPASSIASDSSSGPSSPDAGPFTPTTCLQANFSYPSSCDMMIPEPPQMSDASAPVAALSQGSLDSVQFNYAPFSSAWESASASWEDHHDSLLVGDEFDLNAIPPIELGIPGCSSSSGADQLMTPHASSFDIVYASGLYDHASSSSSSVSSSQMDPSQYSPGESSHSPETFEQLFNFDGMLPIPQGY